jgi:hypothetical protein
MDDWKFSYPAKGKTRERLRYVWRYVRQGVTLACIVVAVATAAIAVTVRRWDVANVALSAAILLHLTTP